MTFSPIVMGSGMNGFSFITRTREQQQSTFDRSPAIDRDVQAFKTRIGSISTAEELVSDRSVLKVALGAFGLDDDINNRAFIQQVLESDLSDDRSFANRLGDKRYLAMARTFGFNSPDGPQMPENSARLQLEGIDGVDDLLSPLNRSVLRGALQQFGLQGNESNTYFLRQVLESDLSDTNSFVNRLGQPEWTKFAQALDFGASKSDGTAVENFVSDFAAAFESGLTAEKLVDDTSLRTAAVAMFGLPNDDPALLRKILESDGTNPSSFVNLKGDARYRAFSDAFRFGWPDINDMAGADDLLGNSIVLADALETFDVSNPGTDRLRDILNSNLSDPTSMANQPENTPWLAMAQAFQTGWPDTESPAEAFVTQMREGGKVDNLEGGYTVAFDSKLREATMDLYGIAKPNRDIIFVQKILDTDLSLEKSRLTFVSDPNLRVMAEAFAFNTGDTGRNYPEGFADAISRRFLDRQFEASIGETDPNMRLALALERELETMVNSTRTNDGRLYSILGSPPLREVFQTAMRLPASFASIDIDQQHDVLKARMESQFGITEVGDFLQPEKLEELRSQFLTFSDLLSSGNGGNATSNALQILMRGG